MGTRPTAYTEKPWPDSLALAFQNMSLAKAIIEAIALAWLSLAYFGLARLSLQPEAGPGTTLDSPDVAEFLNNTEDVITHPSSLQHAEFSPTPMICHDTGHITP